MTTSIFDRLASATDNPRGRRNALKVLGAAAMTAMAGAPRATEAKKRKKRKKRRSVCPSNDCAAETHHAAAAACQAQVALCEQEVRVICGRALPEGEQRCLDEALPCCASLGTCDVTALFTCLFPPPDPND